MDSRGRYLPGNEVRLIAKRMSGEIKYYLSNLPTDKRLVVLVHVIKKG